MAIDIDSIQVENVLTSQEIRDIFETLFRGDHNSNPVIILINGLPKTLLGEHRLLLDGRNQIILDFSKINRTFSAGQKRMGGNRDCTSLRMAAGLVLAHETQHANQTLSHTGHEKFYSAHRYKTRGCELEARRFADENREIVAQILGEVLSDERVKGDVQDSGQVADKVVAALKKCKKATVDDVVDQLKRLKANNPKNLDRALAAISAACGPDFVV